MKIAKQNKALTGFRRYNEEDCDEINTENAYQRKGAIELPAGFHNPMTV